MLAVLSTPRSHLHWSHFLCDDEDLVVRNTECCQLMFIICVVKIYPKTSMLTLNKVIWSILSQTKGLCETLMRYCFQFIVLSAFDGSLKKSASKHHRNGKHVKKKHSSKSILIWTLKLKFGFKKLHLAHLSFFYSKETCYEPHYSSAM